MINDIILPATFRGVPFFFRSHSVDGGRKTVVQEFPDSDRRYIQDLGKLNKTFNIDGFTSSSDVLYLIERDALIAALEISGQGILTHPYFGAINVVPLNYSLNEENRNQGIATFRMTFSIAQDNLTPSVTSNVLGIISEYGLGAIDLLTSDVGSHYKVSKPYPNNYHDASNKISNIGNIFRVNVTQLDSDPTTIDGFNSTLTAFNENVTDYTSDSQSLSTAVQNLFAQANTLPKNASDAVNFFQLFFNFGSDDPFLPVITVQQMERQKNRDLLNAMVQIFSLCYAYMNASLITYTTTIDIDMMNTLLETQYTKVINISNIDSGVFDILTNLRASMFKFFQNAEITAFKVTTVQTKVMPIQVFTYQYYGSLDQNQNLIDLNNIHDTSFIPTTMQVLIQ